MSGKMIDGGNDLTIPDFLNAKNRPKPPKPIKAEDKWKMPEAREGKAARRQKKEDHDKIVLEAVNKGADTFGKIRKELSDVIEKNEISNALRRNIKAHRIRKNGRRYHSTRHR